MARIARVVVPQIPHHITQRGNRRQPTFFCDDDYQEYINRLSEWCLHGRVEVWAYCLMPNHLHLIVVPETEDGLRRVLDTEGTDTEGTGHRGDRPQVLETRVYLASRA